MVAGMLGKDLMKVVCVLQAVGAILLGLMVFQVDVMAMVQMHLPMAVKPLQVVFGLAGVAGLVEMLFGCGDCC